MVKTSWLATFALCLSEILGASVVNYLSDNFTTESRRTHRDTEKNNKHTSFELVSRRVLPRHLNCGQ